MVEINIIIHLRTKSYTENTLSVKIINRVAKSNIIYYHISNSIVGKIEISIHVYKTYLINHLCGLEIWVILER